MKRLFLVLGFITASFSVQAQFYIGDDLGAISYDISDEYIATNRYENFTASILNPALFYLGEKNIVFARFGKKVTRTDLAQDDEYQATNFMEIENYELDIEYFRKVVTLSSTIDGFLGIAHNGHFTYHNRIYSGPFFTDETDSHEMAAFAFSVNALLNFQSGEHSIHYKAGANVFNVGSRPDPTENEIDLRKFSFNEYFRMHHSLVGYIKLNERFLLKPEYKLQYYTFSEPDRFKMLKQSFLMGIFIRL